MHIFLHNWVPASWKFALRQNSQQVETKVEYSIKI